MQQETGKRREKQSFAPHLEFLICLMGVSGTALGDGWRHPAAAHECNVRRAYGHREQQAGGGEREPTALTHASALQQTGSGYERQTGALLFILC